MWGMGYGQTGQGGAFSPHATVSTKEPLGCAFKTVIKEQRTSKAPPNYSLSYDLQSVTGPALQSMHSYSVSGEVTDEVWLTNQTSSSCIGLLKRADCTLD
ncbi:hypothetical protein EYF80_026084 [Liparis tanakae]|uniref:Uncharacterized protein n=1 Tax=Liparis tanakae TaxID=230148 RepID=A0A4Z2HD21_9TELE|nr:hypothetical protein EYF80_026084 [Liparis tanakae]